VTVLLDPVPVLAAINHAARTTGYELAPNGRMCRVGPARWAERHGICSERQYQRWSNGQRLTYITADRTAVALGWHPAELWGDDWWATDQSEVA
jgi:hypothetical protein